MPETMIAVEGGLDLRSASISAPKGTLSNCLNFEKDQGPGLVRRLGWVRYDGRITGPELDAAVVMQYDPRSLTGSFRYGEQVTITSDATHPPVGAIVVAQVPALAPYPPALILAYPLQTFTNWSDITNYPANATSINGLWSGATITALTTKPFLMNDSVITIPQYNYYKRTIQAQHSGSVLAVPGRNESPVDAIFSFANNSYAIHDCVTFEFFAGNSLTTVPVEGHCLRDDSTGEFLGRILSISTTSGSFEAGNAAGQIVIYDCPLGLVMGSRRMDLYDATNTTLLIPSILRSSASLADPNNTRALLYTTYEQYVKDYAYGAAYGGVLVKRPVYESESPPTWTRVPLTRELPYTTVGVPADPNNNCFGPTGTNFYSIYEYTRLGLSNELNALNPQNTGGKFPTIATDLNPVPKWINPNNIKVQDGAVANYPNVSGNPGFVTSWLRGTGFDFSDIPDGSTILGVVVRIRASTGPLSGSYYTSDVRLTSAAFPNGVGQQNKAGPGQILTTSLTDYSYGGATDAWGESLSTAIIKDPTFGVQVRFTKSNAAASQTVNVDAYAITVYYAPLTRTVYIRNPSATTAQDVAANIIHYSIDSGDFLTRTATGVLTVTFGATEAGGTAAGKIRRLGAGDEIRTAPSNPANNAPGGTLLGLVAAEDYPISYPPSAALDANSTRYEVIDANFWDVPEGRAAYVVNGCEYASMYDGTFAVRIRTGRPPQNDNPTHVAAHLGYLHLGFPSGAVVNTGTGRPLSVIGAIGANVINFGEPVTGLMTLNGQTLGCWTDRSTRGLQGTDPSPEGGGYTPIMISPAINCIPYTLVNLVGEAVWASYRGIETSRTVNAYGDFETLPLSASAQSWLQGRLQVDLKIGSIPSRAVYAIGVRNKRQYQLYFADGYRFTLTLFDAGDQPVCTVQRIARPNSTSPISSTSNAEPMNSGVVRHIYNGTRSDGKELILATFENQNVTTIPPAGGQEIGPYFPYGVRMECGAMDDVARNMPAFIEFNAFYANYPTVNQKWASGTMFTNCYGGSQAFFYSKFDFDGPIVDTLEVANAPLPPGVRRQEVTLPLIETRAYIPAPQRYMIFDLSGEGRMLKMRIDCTQDDSIAPALTPMRITHISLTTESQSIDRS